MRTTKLVSLVILSVTLSTTGLSAQSGSKLPQEAEQTMLKATRFMVEKVSTNGGYLWYYTPDLSRRWGEMEAYKTMIWLQNPGTTSVGHMLLDAYRATGDEYYYQAAAKAANAIVWGQSSEGGWNYVIDFAGDKSLKQWYNTIGKNGWRLEEFHHYYGNSTYDDNITSNAARFLLRMYVIKMDPAYKPALDKAISFILKSQYPIGAWPQRYPLMYDFSKEGHPDYTSYYTYNDDVIWQNIHFLIQCYLTLGEQRFLDPIKRGMNFYLISQDGSGGWGQQMDMNLEIAGARTYEPKALLSRNTAAIVLQLLEFYQFTGDRKFLNPIPAAIHWLEQTVLPADKTDNGRYTHAKFLELGTNKPLYPHRKVSNVKYGYYYVDGSDENLLSHYGGKSYIDIQELKNEYKRVSSMTAEEATRNSPLKEEAFNGAGIPQSYYDISYERNTKIPDESAVRTIIQSLDKENRWLVKHGMTSNPYIGDGKKQEPTDAYVKTMVGDETDTSPYRDPSDNEYISTGDYVKNMNGLINYVESTKNGLTEKQLKERQR
jgi:PelA/Pel-15E family pectate lyase